MYIITIFNQDTLNKNRYIGII